MRPYPVDLVSNPAEYFENILEGVYIQGANQRVYFGWIGWINPVDFLGHPVDFCLLSVTLRMYAALSSGSHFQSSGIY